MKGWKKDSKNLKGPNKEAPFLKDAECKRELSDEQKKTKADKLPAKAEKPSEEGPKEWVPELLIELEKDADVFISLGQMDQRLVPGAVYPFPALKKTMISVW